MLTRPPCRFVVCLLTTAAWLGCSTAKTVDVLESRLRHQEDMLVKYESEIKRVKSELSLTREEAEDLRLQLADSGQTTVPAEESGAMFRAAGIQFSALMTGGTDSDGQAGHDALSVVLIPHDHSGELVKLPGSIEIEAFDLSQQGGSQRIGHWTFEQREIHNYWHKGVIQSGYQFELPWQTPPSSEKVLLVGHLSAANGRKFETTLTVKVDPPAAAGLAEREGSKASQEAAVVDDPFPVQQAAAAAPQSDIIWADGEGPAAREDQPEADRTRGFTGQKSHSSLGTSPFHREQESRPASAQARSMSGADFSRELDRASPHSLQTSESEGRLPESSPSSIQSQSSSPPPPLEDWWADDEWAAEKEAPASEPAVRTSDAFTDETIPRYR